MLGHHHRRGLCHYHACHRAGVEKEHPGTDSRDGVQHDYDTPGRRHAGRSAPRPQRDADAETGRLRSPERRNKLPGCHQPQRVEQRTTDSGQQQLPVLGQRRRTGLSGNTPVQRGRGRDVHRDRHPHVGQGLRHRQNHCRQPVSRRTRPSGAGNPLQPGALPRSGSTEVQRLQLNGQRPGRHRARSLHHRDEASSGTNLLAKHLCLGTDGGT